MSTREWTTAATTPCPAAVDRLSDEQLAAHAVDLDAGVTFADLPDGLRTAVAVEVVSARAAGPEGPALVAWLTGRTAEAPTPGPWL